jgi:Flp pilus assembly protein TadD
VGCVVLTFLLYLPTLWYGFVWDDGRLIVQNDYLAQASPLGVFSKGFWYNPGIAAEESGGMAYYRPLSNLTFVLERREFELNPAGFHLTNILIDCAVVLVGGLILFELFGSLWLTGIGALLLGIHPAANCIPAFVSGRPYLLVTLMLLLSFYVLVKGTKKRQPLTAYRSPLTAHRQSTISNHQSGIINRRTTAPLLFGLCFLLGLFSLEAALAFVGVTVVWILLNRKEEAKVQVKAKGSFSTSSSTFTFLWFAAGVIALGIYLLLRLVVARTPFPPSVSQWALNEPLRVLNCFGQEAMLFFFPFVQKVIYVVNPAFTGLSGYTLLGVLFLLAPLVLVVKLRSRVGAAGYVWAVGFMLPSAHLLFLGPSGRSLYLAGFGWLVLVMALLTSRGKGKGKGNPNDEARNPNLRHSDFGLRISRATYTYLRLAGRVAAVLYLVALAVELEVRNPMWKDELSLYQAMVREAPDSPGAHLNLGTSLVMAQDNEEAAQEFRRAIELAPDYPQPHNQLAFVLIGQHDLPGAISELRQVARLAPSADAYNNLALALKQSGALDSAIAEYQVSLALAPESDTTWNNLGMAYGAKGTMAPAIEAFKQALKLNPEFSAARQNLGAAYRAAGMQDSATKR